MRKLIIVGAGISGLALAYECLKMGDDVTLVEKSSEVGGLARSVTHHDCRLDIGVHVMYLKDPEVRAKVAEIIPPEEWVKVIRNGKLYLKGCYMDWPPSPRSIFQLPPLLSFKILMDQLRKKSATSHQDNYESALLHLYGPTLYHAFFHPLTKKFLQTDPQGIHADWAFSSLRAATKIEDASFAKTHTYLTQNTDESAKNDFNVFKFLLHSLKADRKQEPFYYFKDGFGSLVDHYKQKIIQLGGKILLNTSVETIHTIDQRIVDCTINGKTYSLDELVWTGNPYALCQLLGISCPQLKFLHSKFVFVYLKNCLRDHQVCYYADPEISFVRGTILSNHSRTIIRNPAIKDVVCLEYTYSSPEEMNEGYISVQALAARDLVKVKMIKSEEDIESIYAIKAPYSYPVLTQDYRDKVNDLKQKLSAFHRLTVLGRQASFNYENSDIIIKNVLHHPLIKASRAGQLPARGALEETPLSLESET